MLTGSSIVKMRQASRFVQMLDRRSAWRFSGCPAANVEPSQGFAHIAEHFTIVGRNCLPIHVKWIGRYDHRGVKPQHGSLLSIWAMRVLRRLDGAGDAA
jgi:hypothetical protein